MQIALIVAMAANRVIGIDNRMPWHLPADLKRFKALTMGKALLMGRKTHESIGRALPGRENIIVSRNPGYRSPGCLVFASIGAAIADASQRHRELFIIGGASFYAALLPAADFLHLTLIHRDFDGDTRFPEIDAEQWETQAQLRVDNDPSVDFSYSFITLARKHKPAAPVRCCWTN